MNLLKQSTAATVVLGPFVDDTDGKTAETALTISQADVRLSKNGGAFAQVNQSTSASHMENGYYSKSIDTTDTNTLGHLRVAVNESGALPVWRDFLVVPAEVYDAFVSGTGNGLRADLRAVEGTAHASTQVRANVTQFGGNNGTFASGRPEVNATHFGGTLGTFASGRPEVNASHLAGTSLSSAGAIPLLGIIDSGTAQSASSNSLVLRSPAAFADDTIIGAIALVHGSTQGYWQAVTITDYVGSTDTATVTPFPVTPTGTITYYIFGAPSTSSANPIPAQLVDATAAGLAKFLTVDTGTTSASAVEGSVAKEMADLTSGGSSGAIAAAVWDLATSGHTAAGTFGERATRIPNAAAGGSGGLPTVDANNAVKLQSGTGANQISLAAGLVTVGTNNDKTGYSLSGTQTFNLTGNITGNLSGSVGSVTGNLGGTLTTTERNAIADALLDRTNGIESGVTPRQAFRAIAAFAAGDAADMGATPVVFKAIGNSATTRLSFARSGDDRTTTLSL